jgi:zinc finger protein
MPSGEKSRWDAFFTKLDNAVGGELPFTLRLTDPLASSYVQSFTSPEPDPQIRVEEYERTEEEEEDLGLRDIKVEGYEEEEEKEKEDEDEMEKAKKFLEKTTGLSLEDEERKEVKPATES